jgi:hypothetical protein
MGHGIGVLVTKFPKETTASYSLREPAEVHITINTNMGNALWLIGAYAPIM